MTFEEFLDAELDGLGRFARVLTGDRQQAHDTLADSLIKVQMHWRRIGDMDRPLPYVRRIITNTFLQQKRSWVDRMFRSMSPEALPERSSAPQLARVDDRSQLHELLGTLPRQQRAAIVLRHYLGLTDAEIADALGCSTGAVQANSPADSPGCGSPGRTPNRTSPASKPAGPAMKKTLPLLFRHPGSNVDQHRTRPGVPVHGR